MLFPHGTPVIHILEHELVEVLCHNAIVHLPPCELEVEIVLEVVEGAIVEDEVDAVYAVADADGGVAESLIKFVALTACEEACKSRIAQFGNLLRPQGDYS